MAHHCLFKYCSLSGKPQPFIFKGVALKYIRFHTNMIAWSRRQFSDDLAGSKGLCLRFGRQNSLNDIFWPIIVSSNVALSVANHSHSSPKELHWSPSAPIPTWLHDPEGNSVMIWLAARDFASDLEGKIPLTTYFGPSLSLKTLLSQWQTTAIHLQRSCIEVHQHANKHDCMIKKAIQWWFGWQQGTLPQIWKAKFP